MRAACPQAGAPHPKEVAVVRRRAVERARLASGLSQLKPVTVQRLVMAFGRAMNRTIRARASESLSPMTLAGE